jgi:hypothetical protein
MNKKVILAITGAVLAIGAGVTVYVLLNKKAVKKMEAQLPEPVKEEYKKQTVAAPTKTKKKVLKNLLKKVDLNKVIDVGTTVANALKKK